ncbi:MAG TPA: ATP-binding protein [Polyangiaceae bacterium]|jgi:PAS domain S-box-containing protein|nr:ATP-binding protein [Polyangiaceae bacterium]
MTDPDSDEPIRAALRASEERYRFLTETIPVQIWTSLPDGHLDYVSEQTASALGFSAAQLLADGWQNVLHPDDLPLAVERWTHALTTGETYEVEFRLKLASGEYAWHLARAVPQRDPSGVIIRWFGTNTNIEEQRAHQRHVETLAAQEGRARKDADAARADLQSLFMQAPAPICILRGPQHVYTLANPSYMELVGRERKIVGVSVRDALPELEGQGFYEILDGVYATGEQYVGTDVPVKLDRRGEGEPDDAFVTFIYQAFRDLEGRIAGILVVAYDVTDTVNARLGLQAALTERSRLLTTSEEALARADFANRAKDEFLTTASHELRTPLNSILGWAQLLRSGSVDQSNFGRGLEIIERNAKAQVTLIEDILDGSRIITGSLHLEIRSTDLSVIVRAALDAVRPAAAAKKISLALDLDTDAAHLRGDPDRLQQVVWNLVNNALKFTPKGGNVAVRVARVGTSLELSVQDDGKGIAADFLPYVFERFRQADASTTRRHGGLGLGLALVRHLVEAHGGTVHAASAGEGRGATFTVTLPVQAVFSATAEAAQSARDQAGERPDVAPNSLKGVTVLVVDDETDARDLVATLLRAHGADVLLASSMRGALDLLATESADVLVSDIGMPIADGYMLMSRVRALGTPAARIPALALTAYAREEDKRRALAAGFQTYLAKPAEPSALVRVLGELVAAARR